MFGIRFMKVSPTTYVLHYKNGAVQREGAGLAFWYFGPRSAIIAVPLASVDLPFIFNEVSADFQTVTVQGQIAYRIADPKRLASMLDFSVWPDGRYVSDAPEKLKHRLVSVTQVFASAVAHRLPLRQLLVAYETLSAEVAAALKASEIVQMLGLEILGLSVLAITPTPEVSKALEAEVREELQRKSDAAVYARRNAAVELERQIRESELNTEIAIEERKRIKRETEMAADIAVEQQRSALIEQKTANDRKMAESQAYTVEAMLRPVREVDWRVLLALSAPNIDARQSLAMAFRDLAENAQKIGSLNITPDLLQALLGDEKGSPSHKKSA